MKSKQNQMTPETNMKEFSSNGEIAVLQVQMKNADTKIDLLRESNDKQFDEVKSDIKVIKDLMTGDTFVRKPEFDQRIKELKTNRNILVAAVGLVSAAGSYLVTFWLTHIKPGS